MRPLFSPLQDNLGRWHLLFCCFFCDSPPIEGIMKNRVDMKEEGWVEIGKVVPDVLHNGEHDVCAAISR